MTTRSRSNYAIIPHPENACILLLQERDGWTLPRHTEEGAATINRAIKQTFGLEVTVLYAAYEYNGEQEDGMAAQQIDVLENHSAGWQLPAAGRWVSAQQLPELTLTVPGHAQVIGQWFWEREQSHHAVQRRPWATRG